MTLIIDPHLLPPLHTFEDYRAYLRATYEVLKKNNADFSFRYFAKRAGFTSPNFLKLVMDGKRNLSDLSARKVSSALKHGKRETKLFLLLVRFSQAPVGPDKEGFARDLLKLHAIRQARPLAGAQFELYSKWYFTPVRELVSTPDFDPDPEWIASRLDPPISPEEARHALALLETLGLIQKENATYIQSTPIITTGDRIASASLARWHRTLIEMAAGSIEKFPATTREVGAFTGALSDEGREKARKVLRKIRKELWAIAEQDEKKSRAQLLKQEIYHFGFQMFPLSSQNRRKTSK